MIFVSRTIDILPALNLGKFVLTFDDIKQLSKALMIYKESHYILLMSFTMLNFLYLQAWCIPGTFFMNLLAGALFGSYTGLLICSIVSFYPFLYRLSHSTFG